MIKATLIIVLITALEVLVIIRRRDKAIEKEHKAKNKVYKAQDWHNDK